MNTSGCAWCSPSENGTDGICDDCMVRYFGVDPATIHQEIAQEAEKEPHSIMMKLPVAEEVAA